MPCFTHFTVKFKFFTVADVVVDVSEGNGGNDVDDDVDDGDGVRAITLFDNASDARWRKALIK